MEKECRLMGECLLALASHRKVEARPLRFAWLPNSLSRVLTVHLVGQDHWDSLIFMLLPKLSLDSKDLILWDSLVFTVASL